MGAKRNSLSLKTAFFNNIFGYFVRGERAVFSSDELKEGAIKKTGFNDFGDSYFEEGLDSLVEAANSDPNLNNLGRFLLKSLIIHNLSNRLLFCNDLKTNEKLGNTNLIPPIIITGIARSGTTLLHRLLIQDEKNYGPPLWELFRPLNEAGKKDRRKLKAKLEMKASNFIKGDINHIHYTSYQEPEECVYLFGATFNALLYWIQFPLYSYIDWYIQQDRNKKYLDYSLFLKILQSNHAGQRLTLKSPEHLGSVSEIKSILPKAILIETHRNSFDCFNSMNSLLFNVHKSVSNSSDMQKLARSNLQLLEYELSRNREARKNPELDIIDVWYEDLISNPIGVVESIYRKSGIDIDETFRRRMEEYLSKNPQNKYGKHNYTSQTFGLSNAEIKKKLYPLEIPH